MTISTAAITTKWELYIKVFQTDNGLITYSAVSAIYSRHSLPDQIQFLLPSITKTVLRMNSYLALLGLIITCLPSGKRGRGKLAIWDRREKVRAKTRNDFELPSTPLTVYIGLEAATVRIRAYRVTGEVDNVSKYNAKIAIIQGTKLLLTSDVTGLPEDSEVISYRWYHSLTGKHKDRYQIQDRHLYYRVVKDTILIDVTSLDQGGKYTCFVSFSNAPQSSASTAIFTVEG